MNKRSNYNNAKRREQMRQTRERILDGLVSTMAQGIASVSIPAVAEASGVSIPTIYRYFPTKQDLIAALGGHLAAKAGLAGIASAPPATPEELIDSVRRMHRALEGLDDTVRAAAASQLGGQLRAEMIPVRLHMIGAALAPALQQLPAEEQRTARDSVALLASSGMVQLCKDYLGLAGDEAADLIIWAIQRIIGSTPGPHSSPEQDQA
jgi:AcrR family transcriptional regulator